VAYVVSKDSLATALSTVHIEVNVPDATESDSNLALAITVPLAALALLALLMFLCIERNRNKNDSAWKVKKEELMFGDPAHIVGRGTFGLVLLTEHRGTQAAVKRVTPPPLRRRGRHRKAASSTA
jgi:hypothetical protein